MVTLYMYELVFGVCHVHGLTDLHGPEGLADLLCDVEEEVLDLLVLQPARRQQAPSQTAEVGLDLVARPRRHLRSKFSNS